MVPRTCVSSEGVVVAVLFCGRLAPLTYSIGFLNAPPRKVARAVARYFLGGPTVWGKVSKLTGTLEENLLRLQPLVHESWPRVLLTSTANVGC